jgi:hypothetical protein
MTTLRFPAAVSTSTKEVGGSDWIVVDSTVYSYTRVSIWPSV